MSDPTLSFDSEGHLILDLFSDGIEWREAVCPLCGEPIPWILDMASFVRHEGRSALAHAACTWIPEAFGRQAKRAKKNPGRWPSHD